MEVTRRRTTRKIRATLYAASGNALIPVVEGDLRASAMTPGRQGIAARAPVRLIDVVDILRLTRTAEGDERGPTLCFRGTGGGTFFGWPTMIGVGVTQGRLDGRGQRH